MENKAAATVEKYNMLRQNDTVVVGLSGGADSCALLSFLASVREKFGLKLIACHVNHMIRGQEAHKDQEFARSISERFGAEFRLLTINIPQLAKEQREGIEKCARDVRYKFFADTAEECGGVIATAHTASDNAETVIFNLARGSGINGLCGIPPVRGNIIRPLINVTREEVEMYCREKDIKYVTDSTNLSDDYTRNKIRHNVIPVLREINPSIEKSITRMTENMMCNAKHLDTSAKIALDSARIDNGYYNIYKADSLYRCDEAVFARAIAELLSGYDVIPESDHIRLIREICRTSGAVQVKGKIFAVSKQGYLRIIKKDSEPEQTETLLEDVIGSGLVINNKKYSLDIMTVAEFNNAEKNNKILFDNSADYDTISIRAVFRHRQSGDIFRLPGRGISKSLKKLFNEMKIPGEFRDRILVLADGHDIIWIEGIGFSAGHLVGSNTSRVMCIRTQSEKSEREKSDE